MRANARKYSEKGRRKILLASIVQCFELLPLTAVVRGFSGP